METPEVRYARRDGRAIAYQTWGAGPIAILFITEWAGVADAMWEHPLHLRVWRHLGSFGRCIRVDRSSVGSSDPGVIDDLDEWAEDLVEVLDAEDVPEVVICAEAWGGHAAIALATNHPERVDRLLLMNSFLSLSKPDGVHDMNPRQLDGLVRAVESAWGTGAVIDRSAGFGHEYLDWCGRYERMAASPRIAAAMARAAHTSDIGPRLPALTCPTLVVYSAAYTYIDELQSRLLASRIDGAELVMADTETWYVLGAEASNRMDEFLTGSTSDVWAERELAAVVFSDIVDSTVQVARHGDREWTDLLEISNDAVVRHADRFGGRVVKQTGDGHLLTFPSPGAAISAVFAIRRSAHPLGLALRFGVHMGEIERRQDGDIAGLAVHAAARIAQVADGDEIIVSRVVADLLTGTGLDFADIGPRELKGLPAPVHLFSVRSSN